MGEVVVSGEEGMEVEVEVTEEEKETEKKEDESTEVVNWERFLPRMVLSVLLVEADDSTRQIIAALLRKCSYRVAAVPDGLMAWETLKGSPHNIDLILTEVELPSISGYALLTLVMEHDICKNIPVIMMSSKDSISMVLKCMLKGAADFLIKPVRRNELRNLWRHVWRRQTLTAGHIPQNSHVAQHKVEGTSENNAASNNSSDRVNSSQKDKECSEKGSDAESSSTIAYLEAECAQMQNMQGLSQLRFRRTSNMSNTDKEKFEDHVNSDKTLIMPESRSEVFIAERLNSLRPESMHSGEAQHGILLRLQEEHDCAKPAFQDKNVGTENDRENASIAGNKNEELDETPNGAFDLIGAFDNSPKCKYATVYKATKNFEFNPQLELSLRRFYPNGSRNYGVDERHMLNHSNASAFCRYNSKALQPLFPASTSKHADCKDDVNKSPELSSNQTTQNMDAIAQQHGAALYGNQEEMTTLVIGQSSQAELARPSPQHGSISLSGLKLDNISAGYGHVVPSVCYSQSGLTPVWTSKLAGQREQSPFSSSVSVHSAAEINESQKQRGSDETANNYLDQKVQQQSNKESVEEQRYGSAATVQSSSSSLCNDIANNNASGYGSFGSGNDTHGTMTSAVTERSTASEKNVNDGGVSIHDGFKGVDSRRSSQREAALTKFRLKRKERCYEKKVRYQSRKRLAEQRPRVKGQFVRQARSDAPVSDANS